MWLWLRPAAAAQIRPLTWKLPYVSGSALKKNKLKSGVDFKLSLREEHDFFLASCGLSISLCQLISSPTPQIHTTYLSKKKKEIEACEYV